MKTNGTFTTTIAKMGEVRIPAFLLGHFAIHHFIELTDDSYYEYAAPGNPCLEMQKVERWAIALNGYYLNLSHVPSGALIYCPKFKNVKDINKTKWLKDLKQFCTAIAPLGDWSQAKPILNNLELFLQLREALPQGKLSF